jgi:hypothetical protein
VADEAQVIPEESVDRAFSVTSSPASRPEIVIEKAVPYIAAAGWMEMVGSCGCACSDAGAEVRERRIRETQKTDVTLRADTSLVAASPRSHRMATIA